MLVVWEVKERFGRHTVDRHLLPILVERLFKKRLGNGHASVRDECVNLSEIVDHSVHRLLHVIVVRN